jgi:hypothetical protein
MPLGTDILGDGWRDVIVPGVGPLQVRRPLMRDVANASGNSYWWLACVRCTDGTNLLPEGVPAADIRADLGNAILAEIMRDRPTAGSSAASGA